MERYSLIVGVFLFSVENGLGATIQAGGVGLALVPGASVRSKWFAFAA